MLNAHNKYISMHNIKIIQLLKRDDKSCKILANQFGSICTAKIIFLVFLLVFQYKLNSLRYIYMKQSDLRY